MSLFFVPPILVGQKKCIFALVHTRSVLHTKLTQRRRIHLVQSKRLQVILYIDWQTKGDVEGTEEYYARAMQANPENGEVISQYAQLVWELHRDQDKAAGYFKRAVEAAPANRYRLSFFDTFHNFVFN